jgi:hypothetical protein
VELDFVVARRGLDPAAETCEVALRELLGVEVAAVERAELWRFRAPDTSPAASAELQDRLQRAACRAGRYVNLNRDTCDWLRGPRPYAGHAPAGGSAVDVWVRDATGRDRAALRWFRAQASPVVEDVWRGVLWRLYLPIADPKRAGERGLEIAVTRGRRQGLLANPNAQSAEVLHVVPGPEARGG